MWSGESQVHGVREGVRPMTQPRNRRGVRDVYFLAVLRDEKWRETLGWVCRVRKTRRVRRLLRISLGGLEESGPEVWAQGLVKGIKGL